MAVERENQIKNPWVWAQDALTNIPATPTAGVAYRNVYVTQATIEDGQAYSAIYDSSTYNQLFYIVSSVVKSMCEYGIMPFISGQTYKQYARCIWTDGNVYKCSRDIAYNENPYPTPKDETLVWARDGGGTGGAAPAGAVIPFYNVTLGGTGNRQPIFWGESEPDAGWLVCDGGTDNQSGNVPDLRNRFIYGTATVSEIGDTGGAASVTPTITVNGSTSQGQIGNTTLTVDTAPAHSHTTHVQISNTSGGDTGRDGGTSYYGGRSWGSNSVGGGGAHTHTFTGTAHNHTATSTAISTLSPYIKLVYCVKVREV